MISLYNYTIFTIIIMGREVITIMVGELGCEIGCRFFNNSITYFPSLISMNGGFSKVLHGKHLRLSSQLKSSSVCI